MDCPSCQAVMVILEFQGVEVDHCFNCGGVWLDAGELEEIIPAERLGFLQPAEGGEAPPEPKVKCPICGKKMDKVRWAASDSIVLDRCPAEDGGIWFERGELAALLQDCLGEPGTEVLEVFQKVFHGQVFKKEEKQ